MPGSPPADAHAVSGAAGSTSAGHDAGLARSHAMLEAGGITTAELGGVLADAPDPPGFSGGHAVELAAVRAMTAQSAVADACNAAVALASKSGG